ncbi:hypothetical protein BD309DRAFT_176796 [Dichomitus squalens]|nr:hypothetical protein BD309DRAFT_176796 [Dichomitus squalens]
MLYRLGMSCATVVSCGGCVIQSRMFTQPCLQAFPPTCLTSSHRSLYDHFHARSQ